VAVGYQSIQTTLQSFKIVLFLGSIIFVLLSFIIIYLTARKHLKGISNLSKQLHTFTDSDSLSLEHLNINPTNKDLEEEYYLKESIVSMLNAKLNLIHSQKKLSDFQKEADLCFQLAHDLRAPIAALS